MTPENQQIAIAEACGWKIGKIGNNVSNPQGDERPYEEVPDYLNDLNAMHEAEKVILKHGWLTYIDWLVYIMFGKQDIPSIYYGNILHATAAQRAEAFLRTRYLWSEE